MRLLKQAALIISFAAILPSSISFANTPLKDTISKAKQDCKADIDNLCKGVTPGNGRIASCLDSKEDQLTPQCKGSYTDAKAQISQSIGKATVAFRKNCSGDVQKFCSNVPSGNGQLLSCLDQHQDSLSNSCKSFQAKLNQKLEHHFG